MKCRLDSFGIGSAVPIGVFAVVSAAWFVATLLLGCGDDSTPESPTPAANSGIDPTTGLVIAEDWELVVGFCTGCHSAKQFLRQRGTAQTWQTIIDWMQATQGLATFPDGIEDRIVAYLATNYGPGDTYRRAPIPPELMPKNPYAITIEAPPGRRQPK